MTTITLEKAQKDLPTLVQRVLAGEVVTFGAPGAEVKLTAVTTAGVETTLNPQRNSYRGRGALKGQLVVGPEFFEPLSDEECGLGD